MDLNLTPAEESFRQELLDWLKDNLPEGWKTSHLREMPEEEAVQIRRTWQAKLGAAGWLGVAWPKEYGGRGATLMEQVIYQDEMLNAEAPEVLNGVGLQYVGPTIAEVGTDEQKTKFLGPIIRGETVWYQGFSEANAGSDLAGLQTRAELDGDEFIINGQKLWGDARYAEWGAVLARTDPDAPKHKGITFLIVDMKAPGITVGRVKDMRGRSDLGEVFFDNVRVPRTNVLGEVNDGWRVANRTLVYERGVLTMLFTTSFQKWWRELRDYARTTRRNGRLLADDPHIRLQLAQTYTDVQLMRLANLLLISRYSRGIPPGAETSFMKLHWATTEHGLAELATSLGGPEVLSLPGSPYAIHEGRWIDDYLWSRAVTIYGGTQDIQRNIIAERIFGLPRGN